MMNNLAIDNYKETMYRMLRLNIPTLTDSELREAIEYSINENYTNNKYSLVRYLLLFRYIWYN